MTALNPLYTVGLYGINVYDEDVESTFGRKGSSAIRTVVCDWNDQSTLINTVLGGAVIVGGVITFLPPQPFPQAPWMYATQTKITGIGTKSVNHYTSGLDMVGYEFARIAITYAPLDISGSGSSTETGAEDLDFSNEIYTMPTGSLYYVGHTEPIPDQAAPGVRLGNATFTKEIKSVPQLPTSVIISLLGTINNATFLGAPLGQMLYCGCHSNRRYTAVGASNWDLSHSLAFRTQRWDYAYDPIGQAWTQVVQATGLLYQQTDFTRLGFGP